ncbi:hypothetical protein Cgig2_031340 [Carnegiea gigantea]|uniref:PARP-type domain-containing protein n=1 Tax=Carnegiea gigantea TaxID=171969 RepID=A0A9Q1K922_9CARY|nr:hypothetical protein Cgig2_031340 [Carnegiea gigantea]
MCISIRGGYRLPPNSMKEVTGPQLYRPSSLPVKKRRRKQSELLEIAPVKEVLQSNTRISTRKPYSCFCCLCLPMPPSTIVVEYAKSKRSTCKTCSSAIAANALRLGVVSRDAQRGFDMTRWHHLDCFSFDSVSVSSADSIRGFDSLKSYDQDALKKLIDKREQAKNRDKDNPVRDEQEITKKKKVKDKDKNIAVPEEQRTPKKVKPAESEYAKAEAGLAASDIKDKYKGSTLPPKWKAFHTVIFLEKDDGLQDASKIAAFDFDGCLAKTSVKRHVKNLRQLIDLLYNTFQYSLSIVYAIFMFMVQLAT